MLACGSPLAAKIYMSYSDITKIISASVVPVVIISACGLLCLAFYNRMAAIVSRLRGFQRERLKEQDRISQAQSHGDGPQTRGFKLLDHLEAQTLHVSRRAKLIRLTLFFLLFTIALLICCCLSLGFSTLIPQAVYLAVALFLLGLFSMLGATISAMFELKAALQPAELESQFVSEILHDEHHHSGDSA